MRTAVALSLLLILAACRGEPTPRDYQNNPPAMANPPQTQSQAPGQQGSPQSGGKPEPSTGVEGKTTQPVDPTAPSTTLPDTPPTTTVTTT